MFRSLGARGRIVARTPDRSFGPNGGLALPEICRFFGIVIAMYYNDHDPPHFHARYGSRKARIAIEEMQILDGDLGTKARGLVMEWAMAHQSELLREWELTKQRKPLFKIEPLE